MRWLCHLSITAANVYKSQGSPLDWPVRPQDPPYPPTFLAPGRLQSCFATEIFLVDFITCRFFLFFACFYLIFEGFPLISRKTEENRLSSKNKGFPLISKEILQKWSKNTGKNKKSTWRQLVKFTKNIFVAKQLCKRPGAKKVGG